MVDYKLIGVYGMEMRVICREYGCFRVRI